MSEHSEYLAFDLGASGGRAMLARFDGRRFALTEVHRFENGPLQTADGLFWDAPKLFTEIQTGLRRCSEQTNQLRAVGIDTWGVDFGLLDESGELLALPRHYRDPRNAAAMRLALERVPRERIYESTGIQFLALNTLYQLSALAHHEPSILDAAERLLFMPDLFNYWLTGQARTERTIASTSQAMNARTGEWDVDLLAGLGLPPGLMPAIRPTGSLIGRLNSSLVRELDLPQLQVVQTASHDTAAAIAAVPASGSDWAYISSGTWSLVGVELPAPLINADSLAANFTNEAGVDGSVRFLKNMTGLWLLQECRRCWHDAGRSFTFAELNELAERATPLRSLIDPDDPRFSTPGNMPQRIAAACQESGQPEPADEAALIRCILDSLALRYDQVLRATAALTGRSIATVHVVGGGSKNALLNQLIAAATNRTVIAGPIEATALGNAAVQAIALGDITSVAAAREVIRNSVEPLRYEPPSKPAEIKRWTEARRRYADLTGRAQS